MWICFLSYMDAGQIGRIKWEDLFRPFQFVANLIFERWDRVTCLHKPTTIIPKDGSSEAKGGGLEIHWIVNLIHVIRHKSDANRQATF